MSDEKGLATQVMSGGSLTHEIEVASELFPNLKGTFVVKFPTMGDEIRISVIRGKLREGLSPEVLDDQGQSLIEVAATLLVVVVRAPSWFYATEDGKAVPAPLEVQDAVVLFEVYRQLADWRASFRKASGSGDGGNRPGDPTSVAPGETRPSPPV
jgi:hypothetical protein